MRHPQHRRDLRFHEFPERSTSLPIERDDVDDLLQLVLAGENAAAEIADASTAMEDFMVRSQQQVYTSGSSPPAPCRRPSADLRMTFDPLGPGSFFCAVASQVLFLRCSKSRGSFLGTRFIDSTNLHVLCRGLHLGSLSPSKT